MQDEPGALQQEQRNKMRGFSLIVFNLECIILSEDKGCVALIKTSRVEYLKEIPHTN